MNDTVRWYKDEKRVTFADAAKGEGEVIEVNPTTQTIVLKFKGQSEYSSYHAKYFYEPAEYIVYHIVSDSEFAFLARFPVKPKKGKDTP